MTAEPLFFVRTRYDGRDQHRLYSRAAMSFARPKSNEQISQKAPRNRKTISEKNIEPFNAINGIRANLLDETPKVSGMFEAQSSAY